MKLIKILSAVIISTAALTSCNKMSGSTSGIEYLLKTINPSSAILRTDATATILWTSGSATATEIKLEAKNNNKEVEFKSQNPGKVDLFASVAGSLGNVVLAAGNYSEVEFKIELNPNGIDPALQLNGNFTNSSGTSTPVVLTVNSLLEIKSEQNNVTVTDNASVTALTTLDLSQLTTGVTQSMLNSAAITGGKIIISSSSNTNIFNIIINNFQQHHEVEIGHH
jgi:hypothetical protein